MTETDLLRQIVQKQDELINFYGKNISDNAMFLQLHHNGASDEDCKKGFNLRKELASLRQQLEKVQEVKPTKVKCEHNYEFDGVDEADIGIPFYRCTKCGQTQ